MKNYSNKITFLLAALFFLTSNLFANDILKLKEGQESYILNTYLNYYEDETGKLTYDEINTPQFEEWSSSNSESTNFGYSKSVFWFRFKLKNTSKEKKEYWLEFGYPLVNIIDLYLPDGEIKKTGLMTPFKQRDVQFRNSTVRLLLEPDSVYTYYMRVQSEGSIQLPMTIQTPLAFTEKINKDQIAWGFYFGLLLIMILYNLFLLFSIKNINYLYYIIYVISLFLLQFSLRGLSVEYLWNNIWWVNQSVPIFMGLTLIFALQFCQSLLKTRKYIPRFNMVLSITKGIIILNTLFAFVLSYKVAIRIVVLFAMVSTFIILVTAMIRTIKGDKTARIFFVAWVTFLVGTFIYAFKSFGLLPINFFTDYSATIGSAFEVTLLAHALAYSYNELKKENERNQSKLLQLQKQTTEELEQKVEERTRELQQSENRFRDIVYSSNDWVWEVNVNGEYTYVSEQVKSILGYEPDEILGKTPFHIMPEKEVERLEKLFSEIISTREKIDDLENWNIHKNGENVCLLTNAVPIYDSKSALIGYRGVDKDISHLKATETKLKEKNEELIALDDFKKNMTGAFVHDLKNPLNTIINQATSTSLQTAGKQMLNMVMNILDVFKYEDGAMHLELKDKSLYELIRNSVNEIAFLAKQKDVKISHNASKQIEVMVDDKIIERVLVNLLSNAIKYSPKNSVVTIETTWKEDTINKELVIKIKDNGPGIPKESHQMIFERFTQINAKKSGTIPSTGIGLTFCKLAIEAHKGEIGVESDPNGHREKGSTFWFTIPNAKVIETQNGVYNESITDIKNISLLSSDSKQVIREVIKELDSLEVYFITKIKGPLTKIKDLEIDSLKRWEQEMSISMEQCNNEKYRELLEELRLAL